MTEVKLKYNPYTKEKTLWIDGKEQEKSVTHNICGADGKELSEWSQTFYDQMQKQCNDDFTVHFSGIQRDYEFMEDSLTRFKSKNTNVNVELKQEKVVEVADKLNELKELFAKMQNETPFEQLKTEELKEMFEKATNSEFEMAVVATMSSGKSTLINAMLGRELLPARNEATTATIAKIHDIDGADHFYATSYDADGNELVTCNPLTPENMEDLNDIDKAPTSRIEIYGDIPGIESKNIKLVLTDTPGPNNSRTEEHREHTMDLLNADYKPMIIYVLNASQLETNDDNILLATVSKIIKSGDRQSRDRFIFVLNKADVFNPQKNELVSKKIDDTKAYLKKHGIEDARVFPTAAQLAKIIRQYQNGLELSEDEEDELATKPRRFIKTEERHFSKYADFLSSSTFSELDKKIEKAKADGDEKEEALLYTGVPSIELAITEYLSKYALPTKISEGVYSFKEKIDALGVEAATKENLAGNEEKIKELRSNLEKIQAALAKGDNAHKVREEIKNISTKDDMNKALADAGAALVGNFNASIQDKRKTNVSKETANAYMGHINDLLKNITASFTSSVDKSLNDILKNQAELCVQKYKDYVEELIGSVEYELPAASILGDVATISVDETLDSYTRTENVKVGSHQAKNYDKKWYKPWTWFQSSYYTVDDYEKQELVNFSQFIDNAIFPQIREFEKETRNAATVRAAEKEKEFKEFFLNKLNELDDAIKAKIAEQEANLADQQKFEKMIAENKKNLAWLESFKKDLDDILSI